MLYTLYTSTPLSVFSSISTSLLTPTYQPSNTHLSAF